MAMIKGKEYLPMRPHKRLTVVFILIFIISLLSLNAQPLWLKQLPLKGAVCLPGSGNYLTLIECIQNNPRELIFPEFGSHSMSRVLTPRRFFNYAKTTSAQLRKDTCAINANFSAL
jgi:hypothetical protein